MLSVLIETRNDEERLARTLAVLVGAVVEGVVREVIVCDRGSSDQTHYVAEHAGCQFLAQGGIAAGIARAKGDWLLIVEPGAKLIEGWIEPAMMHMGKSMMPARFSRSRHDRQPYWARLFSARRALAEGLVISKRQASALARNSANAEGLARGLATKQLTGEIAPAPSKQLSSS